MPSLPIQDAAVRKGHAIIEMFGADEVAPGPMVVIAMQGSNPCQHYLYRPARV